MERRPAGWTSDPKVREAYEEGGRAIGKTLLWHKSQEPVIWALIDGLDLYPRWYLSAFRSFYIAENRKEYRRWVDGSLRKRRRKPRQQTEREEAEKKASLATLRTTASNQASNEKAESERPDQSGSSEDHRER
jgi:hypothetical protein